MYYLSQNIQVMGFFTKTKEDFKYKFEQAEELTVQNENWLTKEKSKSVINVFKKHITDLRNQTSNPQDGDALFRSTKPNAPSGERRQHLSSKSILVIALVILAIIVLLYFCSAIIPHCVL